MCRRRRKTLTFLLGTIFLFFTVEIYYLKQATDIPTFYINENEVNQLIAENNHVKSLRPIQNETLDRLNNNLNATPQKGKPKADTRLTNRTQGLFAPKLSPAEKRIAYKLLDILHNTMLSSNITYWIYSGTLLGSFRHHDLIPWDDDLDIFTDIDTKEKLIIELTKLSPEFTVYVAGNRVKFYVTSAVKTSQFAWTFPYIDISFYKDNGTNIYDYSDNQDMGDFMYVFEKQTIFPLHLRPLGDLMVNAPRDSLANLKATYPNLNECRTPHYQHRNESLLNKVEQKPCEELKSTVPFVHRKADEQGVEETLKLGEEVIQTILVDEPHYAITDPYTLNLL